MWAHYVIDEQSPVPATTVVSLTTGSAPTAQNAAKWFSIHASKADGTGFHVWTLTSHGKLPASLNEAKAQVLRYVVQVGVTNSVPLEFKNKLSSRPVLPSIGAWPYLVPKPLGVDSPPATGSPSASSEAFPERVSFLGHTYHRRVANTNANPDTAIPQATPLTPRIVNLLPEVMIGLPSNTRQVDEKRRYNGSDYALRKLTQADYREMAEAGVNCFRVDREQRAWIEDLDVFHWGIGGQDVTFPDCLFDSRYLGPALFLDEPAVHTRDSKIRPRLRNDEAFRLALNVPTMLESFRETFDEAWRKGAATSLMTGLASRPDVALGAMHFPQANLYTWETMVAASAYELSQDAVVPEAMVFEPPGRLGTRRTLPEMNIAYGCQIPTENPNNFIDIVYGFLRGAARATGKQWGMSIYGAVDRADAPWFFSRAYTLGATRFFFWDNYQLACVPYSECLSLARHVKAQVENHPDRDLQRLLRAAEVAILLPPGYELGHVHMGKGNLWGLPELNLERTNGFGVKYRDVMGRFFTEIERCERLGVGFDLLWDLPNHQPTGYREVVRVREDGKVEVTDSGTGGRTLLDHARIPTRPQGQAPTLAVQLTAAQPQPGSRRYIAKATVSEGSAPVYFTFGSDSEGVYRNAAVAWELYGPGDPDYRWLMPSDLKPRVAKLGAGYEVTVEFGLDRPGKYRLRAATADIAGRTTVNWTPILVTE